MIGPYKVKQLVGSSCQLDLPTSIKIHNVFYPSLLQKATSNLFPGQHNAPVPSVIVNDKEKWKVNNILDARKIGEKKVGKGKKVGKKVQFCVKWKKHNKDNK